MKVSKSIQKYEYRIDRKAERFLWKHPVLGFFSIFIGVPVFILACVCISTLIIAFPVSWVLGIL